jgi:deoxycytidylate deaminase
VNDDHYKLATVMASKSISRFRLGAVLAKKNRVLSTGYNDMRNSHPLQQKFNPDKSFVLGLHAEVHSCIGVPMADLDSADLYVVRILKDGHLAMAKPCKICQRFLLDVGIRRVYYSFDDDGMAVLEIA